MKKKGLKDILKNKKALSTIIVTLILILVSLVAVGIFWVVIQNLIQGNSDNIGLSKLTFSADISQVHLDNSSNNVSFMITRKAGAGEIVGMKFIFENATGGQEIVTENFELTELASRKFQINLGMNVTSIKKVSVVPLFKSSKGEPVVGNVVANYNFKGTESKVYICGNGVSEPGEFCDGADIDGAICQNLGFTGGGPVQCTASCNYNTILCTNQTQLPAVNITPILWYKFDGNLLDSSTNNLPAQWVSGTGNFVIGRNGQAVNVSGAPSVRILNNPILENWTQLTLSVWIRKNNGTGSSGYPVRKSGTGDDYFLRIGPNYVQGYVYNQSGTYFQAANYSISRTNDNLWHQYVIIFDGSIIKVYADPEQYPFTTATAIFIGDKIRTSSNPINIDFDGDVDDLIIYNQSISLEQTFLCSPGSTRLCEKQLGVCAGSSQTCGLNNFWPGCNYLIIPRYETIEQSCDDGYDNDCDGNSDENDDDCSPVFLELYMADPEVRIAQKIYCQINNSVSSNKLRIYYDGDLYYEKNGNLNSEEIVLMNYTSQTAGAHSIISYVVNGDNDQVSNTLIKNWTTLHNGIPTVGIDENNALRVNGELYFPIFAQTESRTINWITYNLSNTGFGHDYRYPTAWDYTELDYEDWINSLLPIARTIGPAVRWKGLGVRPDALPNTHGKGNNLTAMIEYILYLRNNPGVFMWSWADEADLGGTTYRANPDEVRNWTELNHQYDTNHPHYENLGAYQYARDDSYSVGVCRDYSYLYGSSWYDGQKKLVADIIGFDFYPIEYRTLTQYGISIDFESMAKALDRIREYNYDLTPIISWNENCDLHLEYTNTIPCETNGSCSVGVCSCSAPNCCTSGVNCPASTRGDCRLSNPVYPWTAAPESYEMWAEYWIKIIHGAKGFNIHNAFSPDCTGFGSGGYDYPRNYQTMQNLSTWIEKGVGGLPPLKNAVLGSDSSIIVTDQELGGGRIDIMVKESGNYIYIIAGNLRRENQSVRFTFGSTTSSTVQVYGENRNLAISGNTFTDNFSSLGIHIYRIAKS